MSGTGEPSSGSGTSGQQVPPPSGSTAAEGAKKPPPNVGSTGLFRALNFELYVKPVCTARLIVTQAYRMLKYTVNYAPD